MHLRLVLRLLGILVFFLGVSMAAPLFFSLIRGDAGAPALASSSLIACVIGLLVFAIFRKGHQIHLSHRDGIAIVALGWAVAGLVGAIPFLLSGSIKSATDACFESVSGFTTTGASILTDIEKLPESILLWRSIIQWVGGMGIIVLSIAVLPFLGVGGMQLYRAEIPSPVVDKLKPRISDTARTLWKVYILFTGLEILLLAAGGMSLFDAVNHAFCTMPTGGFSPKNGSIAHYDSPYFDGVIILFMLIAGINFSLHYRLLRGDFKSFLKDAECRVFLGLVAFFILAVTINIYGPVYDSLGRAFRHASFQVSSIITTTGFVTADYGKWPFFSQKILILCMFLGGMAGSTGGGLKTMRITLLAKHTYQEIFKIIHPHAVTSVKLGGKAVPTDVLNSILGFTFLALALFVVAALAMAALGLDMISAFSSVAACIFNVGPGLGLVGPIHNYSALPLAGKWILVFCMLVGRLEFYTVIMLLIPEYWRK
jgi:trk system potassium uptake protein TrkH